MTLIHQGIRVAIVTLGCSKNLVDAECMSMILENNGYTLLSSFENADVIVINTCGFIESAKSEAIDMILSAADYKKPRGPVSYIIVTGCLSQRYPDEILSDLPEVDAVLGTGHYGDIHKVISSLIDPSVKPIRSMVSNAGGISHLTAGRKVSTETYAWLKIAEGCSHSCAYCAIPIIRGPLVSRPMEDILQEAGELAEQGFEEIILAAQDTTSYGMDICGKRILPELLSAISRIESIRSIRIMYAYIDGITDDLIREIKSNPKIAHYLDIPVQHASDDVLKRMGRRDRADDISFVIQKLRREIPDIILRSTVIVGFPGETDDDFDELLRMLEVWSFDRLGCFVFSPEEGTRAFSMSNPVDSDIALDRFERLMSLQREISFRSNQKRMNSVVTVTIDSVSEDGIFYIGRSYGEAPEVDPSILVLATSNELKLGKRYRVRLVDCSTYDMTGVTTDECSQ
ncbi:MAG: 30S ribosomal protein S12 methylthiotransferase RimO [Clostridiaceae bacterium]|jgi:ribosomal protein S12 methylthiotransferase|nr:30S ribosomal protein S12 methylthiotransferase RimO [Clostridiaceae bacterium]